MRRLAVLSLHTSPLAQPGAGDGGGMNVYVRQLAAGLARVRRRGGRLHPGRRPRAARRPGRVEPGLRGPPHRRRAPRPRWPRTTCSTWSPEFVDGVARPPRRRPPGRGHPRQLLAVGRGRPRPQAPLRPARSGCTFHTLARVKGAGRRPTPGERDAGRGGGHRLLRRRAASSCPDEADQLVRLYGADPERVEIVAPGVDHAFFGPGSRAGARRAIGVDAEPAASCCTSGASSPSRASTSPSPPSRPPADGAPVARRGRRAERPGGRAVPRADPGAGRALGSPTGSGGSAPQPHELLASYYRAADVVLVPSQSESFGLVALEAAACGTPGGGHRRRRAAHPGRRRADRIPAEPRTPEAFAGAAAAILADPALAADLGCGRRPRPGASRGRRRPASLASVFGDLTDRVPVACS